MKTSIIAGLMVALLATACGSDATSNLVNSGSSSSSTGSNTTTLNASNLNTIVITTTANNVGASATYYNVSHFVDNSAGNNVFNAGTNYSGTIVTTCVRGTPTTIVVPYTCTTTYGQTSAPFNAPDNVQTVRFTIGETYTVRQEERVLLGATQSTTVGSFVMQ